MYTQILRNYTHQEVEVWFLKFIFPDLYFFLVSRMILHPIYYAPRTDYIFMASILLPRLLFAYGFKIGQFEKRSLHKNKTIWEL